MFNYEFGDELTKSTFSRNNAYHYNRLEPTTIQFSNQSQEVAFIYKEPNGFHRQGYIMYSDQLQFLGRTITRDRAIDIVNTARVLLKLSFQGQWYLMGKGFIGLFDEALKKVHVLFVVTIPNQNDWLDTDVKFYQSKLLRTSEFRPIQVIVETLIGGHQGDIIISEDIGKLVGDKIVLPRFNTLRERRLYIDSLIEYCLTTEKSRF